MADPLLLSHLIVCQNYFETVWKYFSKASSNSSHTQLFSSATARPAGTHQLPSPPVSTVWFGDDHQVMPSCSCSFVGRMCGTRSTHPQCPQPSLECSWSSSRTTGGWTIVFSPGWGPNSWQDKLFPCPFLNTDCPNHPCVASHPGQISFGWTYQDAKAPLTTPPPESLGHTNGKVQMLQRFQTSRLVQKVLV